MIQDFRPEGIANLQRALVSLDLTLVLAASTASLFALPRLARLGEALRARVPAAARRLVWALTLGVGLLGAAAICFYGLSSAGFPAGGEQLKLAFPQRILLAVCLVLSA